MTSPRQNLEAEEAVIGAALLSREMVTRLVDELAPQDFVRPSHAMAWSAIQALHEEGAPVDAVTVAAKLANRDGVLTSADLMGLQSNTPAISHAPGYAHIVRTEASARRARQIFWEGVTAIDEGGDPVDVADVAEARLRSLDRVGVRPDRFWMSTAEYLAAPQRWEWLIPHFIAFRGRILVLATEKGGKSTLLRQIAECIASGLHPWRFDEIPPIRVLILDVENDDDELEPALRRLDKVLSARLGPDRPRPALFSLPWILNLRSRAGRSQLDEVLEAVRPQLIIGGPIVNFYERGRNESEDAIVSDLKVAFNDIRRRWGCALILEHHSVTDRSQGLRSKGGQAWDAWTNATVALYARDGGAWIEAKHNHPPRGQIIWPKSFVRGTRPDELPWMPGAVARNEPPPIDEPTSEQEELF